MERDVESVARWHGLFSRSASQVEDRESCLVLGRKKQSGHSGHILGVCSVPVC